MRSTLEGQQYYASRVKLDPVPIITYKRIYPSENMAN